LPGGVALAARNFEGWARWSGTSFATPAVAGAIAALAEQDGITVRDAAFRLVQASGVPRVPVLKGGGAIVG
jgi:subtilisin family serine protease